MSDTYLQRIRQNHTFITECSEQSDLDERVALSSTRSDAGCKDNVIFSNGQEKQRRHHRSWSLSLLGARI